MSKALALEASSCCPREYATRAGCDAVQLLLTLPMALSTQLWKPWKWTMRLQPAVGSNAGGIHAAAAGPGRSGNARWVRLSGMGCERGREHDEKEKQPIRHARAVMGWESDDRRLIILHKVAFRSLRKVAPPL